MQTIRDALAWLRKWRPWSAYTGGQAPQRAKKRAPGHKYGQHEHSTSAEHQTAEQYNWRRQNALNLFTTLFAAGAVFFAYRSFIQTKRQADIAEEGNRAYVIGHSSYDRLVSTSINAKPPPSVETFVGYALYTNYGKTPAFITSVRGEIVLDLSEPLSTPSTWTTGLIAEPGKDVTSPFAYYRSVTQAEADKLASGAAYLYFRGKIEYREITQAPHYTSFCYKQLVENTGGPTNHIYKLASGENCVNEVQ